MTFTGVLIFFAGVFTGQVSVLVILLWRMRQREKRALAMLDERGYDRHD